VVAASRRMSMTTVLACSKGAPVPGVLPTAVMGLGEAPPDDESVQEAVQRC
jgi:hypothetical protein